MEIPEQAARALEAIRRTGEDVRFEVAKVCGDTRFRLSVRYRRGEDEVRVGLLYGDDRSALEELKARLDGGG